MYKKEKIYSTAGGDKTTVRIVISSESEEIFQELDKGADSCLEDARERVTYIKSRTKRIDEILSCIEPIPNPEDKKMDKLITLIVKYFEYRRFDADIIKKAYEKAYSEGIPISTVGNYLSRLSKGGAIRAQGKRNNREYKLPH